MPSIFAVCKIHELHTLKVVQQQFNLSLLGLKMQLFYSGGFKSLLKLLGSLFEDIFNLQILLCSEYCSSMARKSCIFSLLPFSVSFKLLALIRQMVELCYEDLRYFQIIIFITKILLNKILLVIELILGKLFLCGIR